MRNESFEEMLTGGHPNSLGRTLEVVEIVFAHPDHLEELYRCYSSSDEIVRLRTSNAFKRLGREHPEWLAPYLDRFISEVAAIDQASAQWTLAQLFQMLESYMSSKQKSAAVKILKNNLATHNDWIVLNMTMQTLAEWAQDDPDLKAWLLPHLQRLSQDHRKSVAKKAIRLQKTLA